MASACPKCGHPIALAASSAAVSSWNHPPERPGSKLSDIYRILTIFGIIGLMLGFIFMYGGDEGWGMSPELVKGYYESSEPWLHTPPNHGLMMIGAILAVFAGIGLIVGSIYFMVWLYKAWKVASRRPEDPSPGQAIGFLFIPFFNLYWVFRVVPGLSAALHRNLRLVDTSWASGTAGHGIGIAAAVISVIPFANFLSPIFFYIWIDSANRAKDALLILEERSKRTRSEDLDE